jgi:hypothetical protein
MYFIFLYTFVDELGTTFYIETGNITKSGNSCHRLVHVLSSPSLFLSIK